MTLITATLLLGTTAFLIGLILTRAAARLPADKDAVVASINRLLPQTQCAQCGYPGCRPYAAAIATGEAINRCPPGGQETITALSQLLGRSALPLDTSCGVTTSRQVAVIREAECIGCTLCIQACPVDAIIGAAQWMHTVIAQQCTGCELCIDPCPVDCIDLIAVEADSDDAALMHPAPVLDNLSDCIRCGRCEPLCPRDLAPQALFWYRANDTKLDALDLEQCVECRVCDRVCPSELPLTAIFREAKQRRAQRDAAFATAAQAESRFDAHLVRLANREQKVRVRPSAAETRSLLDQLRRQE